LARAKLSSSATATKALIASMRSKAFIPLSGMVSCQARLFTFHEARIKVPHELSLPRRRAGAAGALGRARCGRARRTQGHPRLHAGAAPPLLRCAAAALRRQPRRARAPLGVGARGTPWVHQLARPADAERRRAAGRV